MRSLPAAMLGAAAVALATGCAAGARRTTPELSELEGRRVALIAVEGEATARKVVEVALVNQLVENGTFILVNKKDVDVARARVGQDPADWKGLARSAGAELALRARVLTFDANVTEGYSAEKVKDSQLAAERGEDAAETERLYKVRALEGNVRVELEFTDLSTGDVRSAVAEKQQKVVADTSQSAAHLPPRLRFLEGVANQAFSRFFEEYR
ncbi:MAG: hypothetical protein IT285_02835 [Bdellovibrionales bacterium]|nr:hypothetical protein [Bdellovibrionales bacterium]